MKNNRWFTGMTFLFSFLYAVAATAPLAHAEDNSRETVKKAVSSAKTAKKEMKKEGEKEGVYVGSKQGHTYHDPSSPMARKIKPENLVTFGSRAEAEKAGYSPSKVLS